MITKKTMTDSNSLTGKLGEDIAVKYLKKHGYRIRERNTHVSHKEIDIIAEDKNTLVFVEVKARIYKTEETGSRPSDAVDYNKRLNISEGARMYLGSHPTEKCVRIDVIEVYLSQPEKPGKKPGVVSVNHIENAFGAAGRTR